MPKSRLRALDLWEGDHVFLDLIENSTQPFFSLKLEYRDGEKLSRAVLDGVELSSHPLYDGTYVEKLTEIAHANGIILTSGGDYHADVPYRPYCGLHLPENITDTRALCDYLLSAESVEVQYQEPYAPESVRATFTRAKK